MDAEKGSSQPAAPATVASPPRFDSPAMKQLSALNEKGGKAKSKTSRLRRAFSFGSAAEFRKAAHDNNGADSAQGKLQKERNPEDAYNEEQERIAQAQEAAGIGSNIYAGGRFFHGSTDNLSISSTASSASIMIRKMGRGMKKSTRSLVGLFRPKSIVGAPVAEVTPPETTQATVSMVTVEAERERVNVNPDPRASGGGTGFPRLERNSIDAARIPTDEPERLGSSGTDSTTARKSIVGGEKERAEVLAAVRKGILKHRAGSSSPNKAPGLDLPSVPSVTDSPNSSAPSTPNEESQRRAGTVTIGSEDYFVSALRLRQDSKSSPSTPQGSKRNATFSPRIVFFETWPSQEYDRRGEVATCNRLTPMLAQQIKEELNSFKMEMEVHENSKIYTHFF
ncbi:bud neck involved protein [Collariella sp. IMI 366227]|nr:bud neck involved protein [Collariella sp. IMI 366227]